MSFPVGAIQMNKQTILDCFEIAEKKETDILIFPELALTGYPPEDLLLRESFIGKNFAVLEELAEFSSATSGVIGFCLLYTSPSPRDGLLSRMPSSA